MEGQKMSSQDRIEKEIDTLREEIQIISETIKTIEDELKQTDLSPDEKARLQEELNDSIADRNDLSADLAMLEELLNKILMDRADQSDYVGSGGGGLDWNESGYFD